MTTNGEKSMTARLFVGLPIPVEETLIPELLRKLRTGTDRQQMEVKWSPTRNLHITLFFMGATPIDRRPAIQEALRRVAGTSRQTVFEIRGIGAFPDDRHARVLWAGVQNSRDLRHLQDRVQSEMADLGFPIEDRDFKPHLTLGRLRKARSVRDLLSPFQKKIWGTVRAEALTLFESHQQGHYPVYKPLFTTPLAPPEDAPADEMDTPQPE